MVAWWLNKASELAGCYCGNDRCFFKVQELEFKVQPAKNNTSDADARVYTAAEVAKTSWFKRRPLIKVAAVIKP